MASMQKRIGLFIPKKATAPAPTTQRPSIFDSDKNAGETSEPVHDVHGAIRRAQAVHAAQAVAAVQAIASSDDAGAFDYDSWKEAADSTAAQDREARKNAKAPRESRYITSLLAKAVERKRERDVIFDRMHAKELESEEAVAGTSEKFVTPAYQAILAERAAAEAEEAMRAAREVHAGTAGSMNDFYLNLMTRNVSFGAPPIAASTPVMHAAISGVKRGRDEVEPAKGTATPLPVQVTSLAGTATTAKTEAPPRATSTSHGSSSQVNASGATGEARGPPVVSSPTEKTPLQPAQAAPVVRGPLSHDAIAAAKAAALARLEARRSGAT